MISLNRWVFSLRRNVAIFPTHLTLTGSEFHREKALVPTFVLTLETKSRLRLDDRSCLGFVAGVSCECKYADYLDESVCNCTDLKTNATYSFLTDRVQLVKINQTLSQTVVTNTGAPQGCVSSPILYILYTNDYTSNSTNNYIINCCDDTAILSLLNTDSDISMYTSEIESFVHWCNINHLKLIINKTQEMIFDAKCIIADHLPVVIHGEEIAQIGQYKYLGVYLDNKLSWYVHVHSVCSKVHQWLYFLRRLRPFGVDEKILVLFYRSIIESILRYGITAWFGNLSVQSKSQLSRLMRTAMK